MIFRKTDTLPRLISHRGCTPVAPERSLPAFEEAGKRRMWAIETDVHLTRDGKLVCCHDSFTGTLYHEALMIEESSFSQLRRLKRVQGNRKEAYEQEQLRMPALDEFLEICIRSDTVPFVETKGSEAVVEPVLCMLEEKGLLMRCVLSSCDFSHLQEARRRSKEIFIHHNFSSEALLQELSAMGNAGLSYDYPDLHKIPDGLIEKTHQAGVKVCLRAGDNPETVKKMVRLGLDYIPTNTMYPPLLDSL